MVISQGGKILVGGNIIESEGNFVQPTLVEISSSAEVVKEELFAPVLHVMKFQVRIFLFFHQSENIRFRFTYNYLKRLNYVTDAQGSNRH